LPKPSRFVRIVTLTVFSICFAFGQQAASVGMPATPGAAQASQPAARSWEADLWNWPVLRFFASLFEIHPAAQPAEPAGAAATQQPAAACSVAPLDPINDPVALELEASNSPAGAVDVNDMVPAAAHALNLFESKVAAVGGSMELKSAYRPAAYQRHLQNVWYKWMDELRDNSDPACQDLRAQVQQEFLRHHLIETQHPVAVSDHTRGLAFDATVSLPARSRIGRRRFTLDGLARLAGLLRPAIAADPVHFKFIGAARVHFAAMRHSRRSPRSA
jgi:hypothetical protein